MNETPKTEQAPVAETEVPVDETALSDDQLEGVAGGCGGANWNDPTKPGTVQ